MYVINQEILLRVSFPKDIGVGKDVHYTIYDIDGNIVTPRTNSGVINFEYGHYGIKYTFTTPGSWLIIWDIDNQYDACEELNVYDLRFDLIDKIYDYTTGRWFIDNVQNVMIFYKEDNTTEIARYALSIRDIPDGTLETEVYQRTKL